jgi:hypothetical protein
MNFSASFAATWGQYNNNKFHNLSPHIIYFCFSFDFFINNNLYILGPDWQNNPDGLGSNSNFGSKVDRHQKKGSPVVPGSLTKVMDDNDSILYTVTVLRSMYEVSKERVVVQCILYQIILLLVH